MSTTLTKGISRESHARPCLSVMLCLASFEELHEGCTHILKAWLVICYQENRGGESPGECWLLTFEPILCGAAREGMICHIVPPQYDAKWALTALYA